MILVIEGLGVGAGKSFLTLTMLLKHFCDGGTAYIVDTFQLNWDKVKAYCYERYGYVLEDDQYRMVSEDKICDIHKHTAGGTDACPVVIVLDEAQGELNSRDWNDKRRRDLFKWACQSRHDSNDVWFISQSAQNIDKQIRRLATYTFRVRNTKMWGSHMITKLLWVANKLTFGLHPGAYFVVRQLDADGKTNVGKPKWLEQDPEVFACYTSKSMAGKHQRGGEIVHKRQLARKSTKTPVWRWCVAACVVALMLVGCGGCRYIFPGKKEAEKSTVTTTATTTTATTSVDSKGPYDVRSEKFRSQWGHTRLITDAWIYEEGRMCPEGMVELINDGQVRIRKTDGRYLYVLGDKNVQPVANRAPIVGPTATPPAKKP